LGEELLVSSLTPPRMTLHCSARTVARNQRTYIHVNRSICLTVGVAYAPKVSDPPVPVLPNFRWGSGVREGSWVSNSLNHLTRKWSDNTNTNSVTKVGMVGYGVIKMGPDLHCSSDT
jgi:hypothetical protein